MNSLPGLFLDRDGTIVEDGGYLHRPEQIRLLPGARDALRKASRFFRLYLVTNQSGIGRGYYTLADAEACNARMVALLGLPEPAFHGICIAPESPDEPSAYRKPSPRYIVETLARDGLDPTACWMVGDRLSDLQCGIQAGIRAALVRQSEHAATPEILEYVKKHAIPGFDTLADCVDALVRETAGKAGGTRGGA